jgi:DNA-binding NtrC family response regulator
MAFARDCLSHGGFPAIGTVSSQDTFRRAYIGRCRVILADCKLPGRDGVAFLEQALRQDPRMHVLLMSAAHSVDSAIEAIQHGTYDYLCKPLEDPRLTKTLDDLAEQLRKLQNATVTLNGYSWPLPLSEM